MVRLKTDKELKAESLAEIEGFRWMLRGTIEDGLYLMAVREEVGIKTQQGLLTFCLNMLKNNRQDVIKNIQERYNRMVEDERRTN